MMNELNEQQRLAVSTTDGIIKIVAGAGSGKTKTLVARYTKLYNDYPAARILCMTFTNKAANEMITRIRSICGAETNTEYICTIHGFCVKFLNAELYHIGWDNKFTVMDDISVAAVLRTITEHRDDMSFDDAVALSEKEFNDFISSDNYVYYLVHPSENIPTIVSKFFEYQKNTYSLRFDDLIYITIYLMETYPDILVKWNKYFDYIMVDEAQDCNKFDWQIINALGGNKNVFIVGDPDQCIYEWRGSAPDMFTNYVADTTIFLNTNYRSTHEIVTFADKIVTHNTSRIDKNMVASKTGGSKPKYIHCSSQWDEAKYIVTTIKHMILNGEQPGDFAILYRSTYMAELLETFMMKNKMSYAAGSSLSFYDTKEIRLCLLCLKSIISDDPYMITAFLNELENVDISYDDIIIDNDNIIIQNYAVFSDNMRVIRNMLDDIMNINEFIDIAFYKFGIHKKCSTDFAINNIKRLTRMIYEYSITLYGESIRECIKSYLNSVALSEGIDNASDDNMIHMMTIHQAKGLEFKHVFIIGMSEGSFPNYRSIKEQQLRGEEEERRLMYVACTRAEESLYMTDFDGYCGSMKCQNVPSRFLMEVPADMYIIEDNTNATYSISDRFEPTRHNMQMYKTSYCYKPEDTKDIFHKGDIVRHVSAGLCEIIEYNSIKDYYVVKMYRDDSVRKIRSEYLERD